LSVPFAFQLYRNTQKTRNAAIATHIAAFHSPRMGMPERRKKSSGASRPSIVKTTSFGTVVSRPESSESATLSFSIRTGRAPRARRSDPSG
jgi:hypothetical protein